MKLKQVDIDSLPKGTLVYDAGGMPLGWIAIHLEMNGNYRPKALRVLNNGSPKDRHVWRREVMYGRAKESGVYVKDSE